MKTCLQMGLTNVRHAMVGSLSQEKNWRNTIKSNMVQVLFDLSIGILLPWSYQFFFLIALIKKNYYETFRLYYNPNLLSNLLVLRSVIMKFFFACHNDKGVIILSHICGNFKVNLTCLKIICTK